MEKLGLLQYGKGKLGLSETSSKRFAFRGTAIRGSVGLILFLVVAFVFEFLLVYSFLLFGLTDKYAWVIPLQVPGTSSAFNIVISPLFHLLPATVLIVLLSCRLYLTRYTALALTRAEASKRVSPAARREFEKRRLRSLRRFAKGVSRRFQRVGRSVKAGFLRVPGVSFASRRLSSSRASVRSALVVFEVFISISLLLYIVVYPDLIRNLVVGFYRANPSSLGFATGVGDWLRGVGEALPAIGGLGTAFINGLWGAAPSFKNGLAGVGASLTGSIVSYDVAGKYILSQNVASLTVVFVALLYGWLVSSRRPRRR